MKQIWRKKSVLVFNILAFENLTGKDSSRFFKYTKPNQRAYVNELSELHETQNFVKGTS